MQQSNSVVHVGPAYPYRGGIAQFTTLTARAVQQAGHPAVLCTFRRQYPDWLFPGRTQTVTDTPPPADLPRPERRIDTLNPWTWHRTAQWMRQGKHGGAVFQYWMPFMAPPFGWMAHQMRAANVPTVAVVHNALPHERHWGDAWLSRWFLQQLDGAVVLSEAVQTDLHRLLPELPVRHVPHPTYTQFGTGPSCEEARAQLGIAADVPVALFFGFVRAYKGLNVLLDAWPAVQRTHPEAHLLIAGEAYDDPAPYRAQMRACPRPDQVHWHNRYIPDDEVAAYFAAADVVAQPYLHATQSGVVRIASHTNRPVIVTDVGGLPESIDPGRTGFIVPPNDAPALAQAVQTAFERRHDLQGPHDRGATESALADALIDLMQSATHNS